jgi:hypothetical protein
MLPTTVAVAALLICNAYSNPETKSFSKPILQSVGSMSLAFLGQSVIFDAEPNFAVPFPTMLLGSLLSLSLVSILRTVFPPDQRRPAFAGLSEQRPLQSQKPAKILGRIRDRAGEVQSEPKSSWVLAIVAILAGLFSAALLLAPFGHTVFPKLRGIIFAMVAVLSWLLRRK